MEDLDKPKELVYNTPMSGPEAISSLVDFLNIPEEKVLALLPELSFPKITVTFKYNNKNEFYIDIKSAKHFYHIYVNSNGDDIDLINVDSPQAIFLTSILEIKYSEEKIFILTNEGRVLIIDRSI